MQLFLTAAALSINFVPLIRLRALEPVQFISVSSPVVGFPGIAHFSPTNIFIPCPVKKRRKDKNIPVSFQMCGHLWEFAGFGQFTSPTAAEHEVGGGTEGGLEAVAESCVSFLSCLLEVYGTRVHFFPCSDAAGDVFADFFQWIVLLFILLVSYW